MKKSIVIALLAMVALSSGLNAGKLTTAAAKIERIRATYEKKLQKLEDVKLKNPTIKVEQENGNLIMMELQLEKMWNDILESFKAAMKAYRTTFENIYDKAYTKYGKDTPRIEFDLAIAEVHYDKGVNKMIDAESTSKMNLNKVSQILGSLKDEYKKKLKKLVGKENANTLLNEYEEAPVVEPEVEEVIVEVTEEPTEEVVIAEEDTEE